MSTSMKLIVWCCVVVCGLSACSGMRGSADTMSAKRWQQHANTIATVTLPSTMQATQIQSYYAIPQQQASDHTAASAAPVFVPPGSQLQGR